MWPNSVRGWNGSRRPRSRLYEPYVPGLTIRPEEGRYDAIRDSAQPGMAPEALAQCDAFRTGLQFLQTGWFWEAHEVLEPVWMACPPNSRERALCRALIQLANARLKARMGKPQAAARLRAEVTVILDGLGAAPVLGMDPATVQDWASK